MKGGYEQLAMELLNAGAGPETKDQYVHSIFLAAGSGLEGVVHAILASMAGIHAGLTFEVTGNALR